MLELTLGNRLALRPWLLDAFETALHFARQSIPTVGAQRMSQSEPAPNDALAGIQQPVLARFDLNIAGVQPSPDGFCATLHVR